MHRVRQTEPYQLARRLVALVYGTLSNVGAAAEVEGARSVGVPLTGSAPGLRLRQQALRVVAEVDAFGRTPGDGHLPDSLRKALDEIPDLIERCAAADVLGDGTRQALLDLCRQLTAALTSQERSPN